MKYRKIPVVVEATQWFTNGDHPEDYPWRMRPNINECEGLIVRYYRSPTVPSMSICAECGAPAHIHGWIDTMEGGHRVCPGDWIITGVKGEHYPCKPDIFILTYEQVLS